MKPIVLVLSLLSAAALAAPTGFAERARYAGGAALIEPSAGGEYIHGQQLVDTRMRSRPVLTAAPERQSYVLFSAEEEEALLRYRDQRLASLLKERAVVTRERRYGATGGLDWPKVLVRAGEVCVPELSASGSADWREHLVCHASGGIR